MWARGETYGLVGESGCGKSTLGRTLVKIYPATGGKILYKGQDIARLGKEEEKHFRKEVQMIFQDPYASLNPRMTVGEIIKEPMEIHGILDSSRDREDRAAELLKTVGLKPDHIRRYPHEFSGGQRQRISIARTLALNPRFIICDEPISALDVSIQAQIINLLKEIQDELGISYLFVAHDLSMVNYISHRIGVMYLGHLVEEGAGRPGVRASDPSVYESSSVGNSNPGSRRGQVPIPDQAGGRAAHAHQSPGGLSLQGALSHGHGGVRKVPAGNAGLWRT